MSSIYESIENGLDKWGFDLCQPFAIEDYNENVDDNSKIPGVGRENTLAILVGNSRELWEKFVSYLSKDGDLCKNDNPLDMYTKMAVESALSKVCVKTVVYYTSSYENNPRLNFQLIAEISGMCKRSSNSVMCYHYKYGHWIGLRAVIVLDYTYIYNLSTKHMIDFEICKECDELYGKRLRELQKDKSMIYKYRYPGVWRQWLALRTICTHNEFSYSYEQACYHYSKNKRVLEKEVERYKSKTWHPDYNWLDKYNKDPQHYREEEDVIS